MQGQSHASQNVGEPLNSPDPDFARGHPLPGRTHADRRPVRRRNIDVVL